MSPPRHYALAVTRDGELLGYLGSYPEWSTLSSEPARTFGDEAEAWASLGFGPRARHQGPPSRSTKVGLRIDVVGLIGAGGGSS